MTLDQPIVTQPCEDKIGYELFFPRVVASIYEKVKKEDQLSETETRAIVALEFKAAIRKVAQDTDGLIVEVPISVYPETKVYPINPPKGFLFNRVVGPILEEQYKLPPRSRLENNVLFLPCCPSKQVTNAYYANIAVIPMMSCKDCEFDAVFVETHYDLIFYHLMANLVSQKARQWKSLGQKREYLDMAKTELRSLKTASLTRQPIRLKSERLSDGVHTTQDCAKANYWP